MAGEILSLKTFEPVLVRPGMQPEAGMTLGPVYLQQRLLHRQRLK